MSELNDIVDIAVEMRNGVGSEIYDSTYALYRVTPLDQEDDLSELESLGDQVTSAVEYTSRTPKLLTSLVRVPTLPLADFDIQKPVLLNTRYILTSTSTYTIVLPDDAPDGSIVAFVWAGFSGHYATIAPQSSLTFDADVTNITVGAVGMHFFRYGDKWGVCRRNGDVAIATGMTVVPGGHLHVDRDKMTLHLKANYGDSITWPMKWPADFILTSAIVSNVPASYADSEGFYVNKDFSISGLSLVDVAGQQPRAMDAKSITASTSNGDRCFVFVAEPYSSVNAVSVFEIKDIGVIVKLNSWVYPDGIKHGICAVTPYITQSGEVKLFMSANGISANSAPTGSPMVFSVSFNKETGVIDNDISQISLDDIGQYVGTSTLHRVDGKLILAIFNEYGRSTTAMAQSGTNPTGLAFMSSDDGATWGTPVPFGYPNTHAAAKCFKVIDGQLYAAMAHAKAPSETYPTLPFMLQCIGITGGNLVIKKTSYQLNEMITTGINVAGVSVRASIVNNNNESAIVARGSDGWYILRLEKDADSLYVFSDVTVPLRKAISSFDTTQRISDDIVESDNTIIVDPLNGAACSIHYDGTSWIADTIGGGYGYKKMCCSASLDGVNYVVMVGYSNDISYSSTVDLYKTESSAAGVEKFIDITGIRVK